MHGQLRHARFNLIVLGIVVTLTACTYVVLRINFGPAAAPIAFGFMGLLSMLPIHGGRFYKKKPGETGVAMDERDKQIRDHADLMGWRIVWVYWGLVCFVPWFHATFVGGVEALKTATISVILFPLFYAGGFVVHQVIWSLAIVFSYRETPQT